MEQITREEMIGLLSDLHNALDYSDPHGLMVRAAKAQAALLAAEPVAVLCRETGLVDTSWFEHEPLIPGSRTCEHRADSIGWETLEVFTLPCPTAATTQSEVVYKCASCKHVYIEPVSLCDCLEHGAEQQWERWVISPESCPSAKACNHCNSTGEMETDNNGPIVPCPLCQPTTELAPESWCEELETIAEILEADGDEWNCAARIRKILKPPTKAHVSEYGDAYQGAREDLAIWKRRALEAEASVRHKDQIIGRLTSELQGDTRFGEPSLPAKAQVPDAVIENLARQYGCYTSDGFKGFALAVIEKHEEARATASPAPNNDKDGCTCQGCGIVYAADLIVPDEWWEKIKPEGKAEGSGLLCPTCIMDRLVQEGWSAGHIASPAPDHSADKLEMVEVPFHMLALGTRFRYTSILESEYVKISATQVARWQDDMAIAGWSGQGVYSFDESDDTNITVLVAATATTCQQEEAER